MPLGTTHSIRHHVAEYRQFHEIRVGVLGVPLGFLWVAIDGVAGCGYRRRIFGGMSQVSRRTLTEGPVCAVARKFGEARIFGGTHVNPGWKKKLKTRNRLRRALKWRRTRGMVETSWRTGGTSRLGSQTRVGGRSRRGPKAKVRNEDRASDSAALLYSGEWTPVTVVRNCS